MNLLEIVGLIYIIGVAVNSFYLAVASIFDRKFFEKVFDFENWYQPTMVCLCFPYTVVIYKIALTWKE